MENGLEILDKKDAAINGKEQVISKKQSDTPDETGYLKIAIKNLPSKGLFYPTDIHIAVKPAGVKEIKHWSLIDETDDYSFIDAMNFVLSSCCMIKTKNGILSVNDLCEVDRLYLIFAIRDLTFSDGSNNIVIDVPYVFNNEEYKDSVVINKENLSYFEINEKLMKLYSESKRGFIFNNFVVKLPIVGTTKWVQDYLKSKLQKGKQVDEFFAKCSPFLISDYSTLSNESYMSMEAESIGWTVNEVSGLDRLTSEISKGAVSGFKHKTSIGGIEVTVPLNFRNGVKSIFIVSDILGID